MLKYPNCPDELKIYSKVSTLLRIGKTQVEQGKILYQGQEMVNERLQCWRNLIAMKPFQASSCSPVFTQYLDMKYSHTWTIPVTHLTPPGIVQVDKANKHLSCLPTEGENTGASNMMCNLKVPTSILKDVQYTRVIII